MTLLTDPVAVMLAGSFIGIVIKLTLLEVAFMWLRKAVLHV